MTKDTDQTNFWLGWKATCAIRDCMDKGRLVKACKAKLAESESATLYQTVIDDADNVVKIASEIVRSTNCEFSNKVNFYSCGGKRTSLYGDQAAHWQEENSGSAFELVEGELYSKQMIKGKPFKSYLFEQIGTRAGSVSQNLYGYVKMMILTMARNSFKRYEQVVELKKDDEGKQLEPDYGSSEDRNDALYRSAELNVEISQVGEFFKKYIEELCEDWDKEDNDYWIILFAALNKMPINNPEVASLCRRKKSALGDLSSRMLGNLLKALRGRFTDRAIGGALEGDMQRVIDEKINKMAFYPELEAIWKKMYGKCGK